MLYKRALMKKFNAKICHFFEWVNHINRDNVSKDLMAGLTGTLIGIPQCLAYAVIAGLPPHFGLYAAIVSSAIAALFGSSYHMISGPTAALSIVSASIINAVILKSDSSYLELMFLLSFMVGVIQFIFYLFRLGFVADFISHSVVKGFTSGAAIVILLSQIEVLVDFKISYFDVDLYSISLSAITIFASLLIRRLYKKIPYLLFGMFFGVLSHYFFARLRGFNTPMLSEMPTDLSMFSVLEFSFFDVNILAMGALSLSILASIEAISISKSISLKSNQCISSNREVFGQGLSNIIGSFFQCYPSSGSFTRSAGNFEASAKTPLSVLFISLLVFLCLVFLPSVTTLVPISVMAGSIILISIGLLDLNGIVFFIRKWNEDSISFFTTFFVSIFIGLDVSIFIGVITSFVFYIKKTSKPNVEVIFTDKKNCHDQEPYVDSIVVRVDGSIYFGSSEYIKNKVLGFYEEKQSNKNLHLIFDGVNFFDLTGEKALISIIEKVESKGGDVSIFNLKESAIRKISSEYLKEKLMSKK